MAISRVGFTKALGTTIAWPVGHAAKDLAVVFAFTTDGTLTIARPAGWFVLHQINSTLPRAVFYRWATSGVEVDGTFTNAEFLHMWVGRGDAGLLNVGGGVSAVGASLTTFAYSGFTLHNNDATSIILFSGCCEAIDNPAYATAPTGTTNLDSQLDLATQIGGSGLHESGLRSTWGTANVSGSGTASDIARQSAEIYEVPVTFGGGAARPSHPLFQQVIG